ncbi:2-oxoisovalerate dehydrogenase subunit alpha [Diplonema papillatum]|nr:2-oxoisovalerate dehydrogenase subunit alpha [Diplonema papillatum]
MKGRREVLRTLAFGGRRFKAQTAAFCGIRESEFVCTPEFRRDCGGFPVLRQLNPDGTLESNVDMPFSAEEALKIYGCMVRSREYDMVMNDAQRQGRITFYCTNLGEEAASTASCAAMQPQDMIWPQYRELGMYLYRGLTAQQIVDCCSGNEDDHAQGRALPVHYILPDANVQVTKAVLGTHVAQAPGAGYAYRLNGEDRVSVAYFGDGAASEGDALSALNYAAVLKCQTLFICRNNGYSISTPVSDQYAGDGIAGRGLAFGMATIRVDGNDVVAVYNATRAARLHSVTEKEPVLLELMTYRVGDHTTSDDSSVYRPKGEIEGRCADGEMPIERFRSFLVSKGLWDAEKDKALAAEARGEIVTAMRAGEKKKKPHPQHMFTDMYDELPWHLREQRDNMLEHIEKNRSKYNVANYRDL